jgi:ribosome-binding protein aMBF1 (putative translation factor)
MDKYFRTVGLVCEMPGCGNRFSARLTPALKVCPECQEVGQRQADAERKAAARRRKAALRESGASA